jgi:hypothetical protein
MMPGALLVTSMPFHAGGWATITVEELPDYVVAGQPLTLEYTVRQHGAEFLSGLNGRITATSGKRTVLWAARATRSSGRYAATVVIPGAGDWTLTIESGFGKSRVTLLPITAITTGGMLTRPLSESDRGKRLFVAKGCVTCHAHAAITAGDREMVGGDFAPDLTHKRFEADYLTRYLADPSIIARRSTDLRMPNLRLSRAEIASLAAFINGERSVGLR